MQARQQSREALDELNSLSEKLAQQAERLHERRKGLADQELVLIESAYSKGWLPHTIRHWLLASSPTLPAASANHRFSPHTMHRTRARAAGQAGC